MSKEFYMKIIVQDVEWNGFTYIFGVITNFT